MTCSYTIADLQRIDAEADAAEIRADETGDEREWGLLVDARADIAFEILSHGTLEDQRSCLALLISKGCPVAYCDVVESSAVLRAMSAELQYLNPHHKRLAT
jgi:hypothetical protein